MHDMDATGNVVVELPKHIWLLSQNILDDIAKRTDGVEVFIGTGFDGTSLWFVTNHGRIASLPVDKVEPDKDYNLKGLVGLDYIKGGACVHTSRGIMSLEVDSLFALPCVTVHSEPYLR